MLEKIIWDLFEKTGSIEAYLYYKKCEKVIEVDLEIDRVVNKQAAK